MSDESNKDTLHFLNAHIDMLDHTSIKHTGWNVSTTTLLLQLLEAPEDDLLPVRETISNIWHIVPRITVLHVRLLYITTPWNGHQ